MAKRKAVARIGTSGYQYDHWKGVFYPEDLPKKKWFDYYAEQFDTVEINNTFYNLPSHSTFDEWKKNAPRGFCFVLKFSRFGSHIKRLKEPKESIGPFMGGATRLGRHLGPILVQLMPNWKVNLERLEGFLDAAPKKQRWALEFRESSWLCDEVYEVLRRHNAALCIHDMIEGHPREITADWVYLRYHGDHYQGSYSHQYLSAQARYILRYLDSGLDVFAYFNNDAEGSAVENAGTLSRYVSRYLE